MTQREAITQAQAWVRRTRGTAVVYLENSEGHFADLYDYADSHSIVDEGNVIARIAYPRDNAGADVKVYYLDG